MALTAEAIHDAIREKFPDAVVESQTDVVDPFVVIRPESLRDVAYFCRDDDALRFDLLNCIAGVDYPEQDTVEVVYCLDSTRERHRLICKVKLPRERPTVPTVEDVWRTADWQERETYDLVGVHFEGHHNLIRILCAEDWEGHPLRRDYVMPDTYHGIKNVIY